MVHFSPFRGTVNFLSSDNDFARILLTLSVVHGISWSPFFVFLLALPVISHPLSPAVAYFVAWLGYTESALNPVIIFLLSTFIHKLVCQTFRVLCGCGQSRTPSDSPKV